MLSGRIGALVVAQLVATSALAQTGLDERRQAAATLVTSEVEAFTGHVDRHCGIFTLAGGPDGPPAADRKAVAAALRCVQDAQRRGRAAWAVWQVAGVDATIFDGVAATAVSAVHVVQSEGIGGRVRVQPCLRPQVQKDAAISCANIPGQLSPSDVEKALDRLRRDARRTAGVSLPVLTTTEERPEPVSAEAATAAPEALARSVAEAQRAVHDDGNPTWPRCPRHFDHALAFKDGWWFCEREAAFIAELGGLWRVLPRKRK